jgi:P27 family predicted phage terminase small subunit
MTSAALVVWEEIAPMLHTSGVLDRVDARMLAMFCEATAQAELARQMMEAARNSTGLVVQQPSGRVAPDPHFTVWKDAVAAARQLAEQFGLTPSARARLGIGAQTQAQIAQIDEHVGQSPRLRAVDGGSAAE